MKWFLCLSALFIALISGLVSQAQCAEKLAVGSVEGPIDRVEADDAGLSSLWLKVDSVMHVFSIGNARIVSGKSTDLIPGAVVRIQYKDRERSEMDSFYTAEATAITVLKRVELSGSPSAGVLTAVIDRIESDAGGTSLWLEGDPLMHHMLISDTTEFSGRKISDLVPGTKVRVKFRNREISPGESFFIAEALTVTMLVKGSKK